MVRLKRSAIIGVLLTGAVLMSGCVAVWGGPYKIEEQSPQAMTVHYDTTFIDPADIDNLARDHCRQYAKEAVLQSDSKSRWGLSTATFACQAQMLPSSPSQPSSAP